MGTSPFPPGHCEASATPENFWGPQAWGCAQRRVGVAGSAGSLHTERSIPLRLAGRGRVERAKASWSGSGGREPMEICLHYVPGSGPPFSSWGREQAQGWGCQPGQVKEILLFRGAPGGVGEVGGGWGRLFCGSIQAWRELILPGPCQPPPRRLQWGPFELTTCSHPVFPPGGGVPSQDPPLSPEKVLQWESLGKLVQLEPMASWGDSPHSAAPA